MVTPVNITDVATISQLVLDEVERAIVGKRELLGKILAALLAGGHVLLEDYPGLGKTMIAKSMAAALGLEFKRIQFTPDLLPGDITGTYVYSRTNDRFELRQGPVFANIILADEINRASPKTQSALLEAMQERQVTLEGETMSLPNPFVVIATQNPIEYEGTFPLPEAQLDRFLLKLSVGYPSFDEEQEILRRRKAWQRDDLPLNRVTAAQELIHMRQVIEGVHIDPDVERYIVALVDRTRQDPRVGVGASPRGSLALLKLSRAWAAIDGRDYVLPDDIKSFAVPALVHRLILKPDLWMKKGAAEDVIDSILNVLPVPLLPDTN
jgi:MoxR-like ATPase